MARSRSPLVGGVYWAIAPYTPAAPLRLYAGTAHQPVVVADVETLLNAATAGGDAQLTVLVPTKLRPVLVVGDAQDAYADAALLALRLTRFGKLTEHEQSEVRAQQHPRLFHLPLARFPQLPEENAVLITDLLRIAASALAGSKPLGRVNAHELRVLHERIARYYNLDLQTLAIETLRERAGARR